MDWWHSFKVLNFSDNSIMSCCNKVWLLSLLLYLSTLCNGFTPVDNYLIDCGSTTNTTIGGRVFLSDNSTSTYLSTSENVFAHSLKLSTSSLFQTARVLPGTSTYTFPIRQAGRHWIRLYFYPFSFGRYDMSTMNFHVSIQKHVLLSNFTAKGNIMKEFSVNVTSDTLIITFIPSNNSYAFLNALEVVSVPNTLIEDGAATYNPPGTFEGLPYQALETVARINMGGPMVSFENDTLWRTWINDQNFLLEKNLATNVSNIPAVKYVTGGATRDTAPNSVYGTVYFSQSDILSV
ncbi:hypothetical protein ACFE04_024276 [Oxalis oulophora]